MTRAIPYRQSRFYGPAVTRAPHSPHAPAPARRVAVIGAGAAGLATVKALRDAGLAVVAFEKGDRPGGLWARDNAAASPPRTRRCT